MLTVLPTISVQPITPNDGDALAALINQQLRTALYSQPLSLEEGFLLAQPPEPGPIYPVRWRDHRRLCAWRAGVLVGFLDTAIGVDQDHLDLPDHQAQGICRFVALTERSELQEETLRVLIQAAETFWREQKVREVLAFPISTGYPWFQAGAGILPTDWATPTQVFTSLGYTFSQRYYLMQRPLAQLVSEEIPQEDLLLEVQRSGRQLRYAVYYRRVDQVALARIAGFASNRRTPDGTETPEPFVHLVHLFVNEGWRNRNIGKWLLRRMINDATLSGYTEMIVFPPSRYAAAIPLFNQQGFTEQSYRGYTLEKEL